MASGSGSRWSKDETILALELYLRIKDLPSNERRREIGGHLILLACLGFHDRSPASIDYKIGNFTHLDPSNHRDGFGNVGPQDRPVWDRYSNSPIALRAEVQRIKQGWD